MGADVPVISRVYEESFMREPTAGERKCVMGTSCEAMVIDKNKPFIAVEFNFPGKTLEVPQMCVLCYRKHTQRLFYDYSIVGCQRHARVSFRDTTSYAT
jgi:hypothetical protein